LDMFRGAVFFGHGVVFREEANLTRG